MTKRAKLISAISGKLSKDISCVAWREYIALTECKDSLLRVISIDKSPGEIDTFECTAIYFPLYYPLPGPILTFSKSVSLSDNKGDIYWKADQCEQLADAIIRQAIPFLEQAIDSKTFATVAKKVCDYKSRFVDEIIAFSKLKSGNSREAELAINLMRLWPWVNMAENNHNLDLARRAIKEDRVDSFFENTINANMTNLGLSGLSGLIKEGRHKPSK